MVGARFGRPFGSRSWIAGVTIAVLAIGGTMAIVVAIPPSSASVGGEGGKIVRAVESDGQDASRADDRVGDGNRARSATSGGVPAGARYAITVRFRDGTTAIFVEDLPRSLPPGGRVIVIGRSAHPAD